MGKGGCVLRSPDCGATERAGLVVRTRGGDTAWFRGGGWRPGDFWSAVPSGKSSQAAGGLDSGSTPGTRGGAARPGGGWARARVCAHLPTGAALTRGSAPPRGGGGLVTVTPGLQRGWATHPARGRLGVESGDLVPQSLRTLSERPASGPAAGWRGFESFACPRVP